MSAITTHVLDVSRGRPAAGVPVLLEMLGSQGAWRTVGQESTNADGRVAALLPKGTPLQAATYRLTFDTGAYFGKEKVPTFYPSVPVVFQITDPAQHHHVPLLVSPYGYSTYRGS